MNHPPRTDSPQEEQRKARGSHLPSSFADIDGQTRIQTFTPPQSKGSALPSTLSDSPTLCIYPAQTDHASHNAEEVDLADDEDEYVEDTDYAEDPNNESLSDEDNEDWQPKGRVTVPPVPWHDVDGKNYA